ncbi:Nicastrin-domain-containing protein [Entophlyctis helioformis]|nr:Nicastrin-domain-containing protein [Entophlyctis helioformis]
MLLQLLLLAVFPACISAQQSSARQQNIYLESAIFQGVPASGCTRLLTSQGSVGCSDTKSSTGVLYRITTAADIQNFAGSAPSGASYTVVMPMSLLSPDSIGSLQGTGKVAAMFVIKDSVLPDAYSTDAQCPNCNFGLYANVSASDRHLWNPPGNRLAFADVRFPIFGLYPSNPLSIQSIGTINEALDFNANSGYKGYPLYSMEFDALMWSAINSETCLRRGWCQPVGGYSVWSTFSTNMTASDKKPIILVSSKLDSSAFIHDFAYGAAQRTGMVAMLGVAEALSRVVGGMASLPKTVIFSAFNAESWSFAGSQRFVADLTTPFTCKDASGNPSAACPLRGAACTSPCRASTNYTNIAFDQIESIIEFDTIGGLTRPGGTSSPHFLHVDTVNAQTSNLVNALRDQVSVTFAGGSAPVSVSLDAAFSATANNRLPPSSAMAFLAKRNIPAVVISDYQAQFSNRFHNSEFDDGSQWNTNNVASLCGVVNSTARNIHLLAGGSAAESASISVNCTLVGELLDCFTRNISCSYLQQLRSPFGGQLMTGYSSVFQPASVTPLPQYTFLALLNWTASARTPGNCSNPLCQDPTSPYNCVANQCVLSMTQYHQAYGTGLAMDESTGAFRVVDPSKGTWTESTWGNLRVRIFKAQSLVYQGLQLGLGLVLTLGTGGLTWYLKGYFRSHFKTD